jgi:hypothetical protein
MNPIIETCAPTSDIICGMGRCLRGSKRISCRLTKLAGQKLEEQLAKLLPDKVGRPPTGALLSQLIMNAEERDWARARAIAKLPEKSRRIEPDRKPTAEKTVFEQKQKLSKRELKMEDLGWEQRQWNEDEE